jgi:hypothetical protein
MSHLQTPESDLEEITEHIIEVTRRDPKAETRFQAWRWLNRLFYDVRKWNLGFIEFLRTYPGFRKSRNEQEYRRFFKDLAKYKSSLDDRYGEAKGDLCANLKMLAARYTLDFSWLYDEDQDKYDEVYGLVKSAYASETSILETAKNVVYDVFAKDNVRYGSELEREIDDTEFLAWHTLNYLAVVQTILDYEERSAKAVKRLNEIADGAGCRLISITEYDSARLDPRNHPEIMLMGEQPFLITKRKTMRSNEPSHKTARLNTILAFFFGVVFVVTILALVVFIPNPTQVQYHFFVIVMALAAGGVATVMTGMIDVRASFGKKLAIGATGALAVFVIVYFFLPAMTGK